MLIKVKNIILLLLTLIFFYSVAQYYFSEKNIKRVNKLRMNYLINDLEKLPLLKNNTFDVIEYKNDVQNYIENKKKYSFENLIKKN